MLVGMWFVNVQAIAVVLGEQAARVEKSP